MFDSLSFYSNKLVENSNLFGANYFEMSLFKNPFKLCKKSRFTEVERDIVDLPHSGT